MVAGPVGKPVSLPARLLRVLEIRRRLQGHSSAIPSETPEGLCGLTFGFVVVVALCGRARLDE